MGKFAELMTEGLVQKVQANPALGQHLANAGVLQKHAYTVHVTRKGQDKPESYDAESYSPAKYVRDHEGNGDAVHKIVHKASGNDVTADARKTAARNPRQVAADESVEPVEESLRKIGQYENGNKKATVHKDADWGEYRVKHHVDGKHQGEGSDYHTDDKQEAHDYAKRWADGHFDKKNESTLSESLRKIGQHENGNRKATVHKDAEWGEYRVKHHLDGKHQTEADYHTDDKEEAMSHAHSWAHKTGVHANESTEHSLVSRHETKDGQRAAEVHHDKENDEYRVKHFLRGKHLGDDADHVNVDKHKAVDHAKKFASADGTYPLKESAEPVVEDKETRNEFDANNALADTQHHVYVSTRGKKKSIAGPFRSKEEAEAHPARKFGDGVTTSDQINA